MELRIPQPQSLAERDQRVIDSLTVAAALATLVLTAAIEPELRDDPASLVGWATLSLALYVRRRHPIAIQLFVLAGFGVIALAGTTDQFFPIGVLMMLISSFSSGSQADGTRGLWIAVIGNTAFWGVVSGGTDILFPVLIFAVLPWTIGSTLRGNARRARELTELAEEAELDSEIEGRRAVLEERRRVARELHDVLAHDLSVIVIQASAATRLVERSPETATEAAELISRTGREAMSELRHLFGTVRHDSGEPPQAAGLAALAGLVERSNAAGMETELRAEGDPVALATGVDLAAYRVIQEALTNSLKHAGAGARAVVELGWSAAELRIRVADDGAGPGGSSRPAAPGGGHGLVGMRERVTVYGGTLEAGRGTGGGFEVLARLPISSAPRGVSAMTARAEHRVERTNAAAEDGSGEGGHEPPPPGDNQERIEVR